jgi:hypothetical protein
VLLVCAKCVGVLISSSGDGVRRPAFFFKSHFILIYFDRFLLHAFRMTASAVVRALQSFVALCVGWTGCAPLNAPYVVYTDERGQVTSAACRTLAAHLPHLPRRTAPPAATLPTHGAY